MNIRLVLLHKLTKTEFVSFTFSFQSSPLCTNCIIIVSYTSGEFYDLSGDFRGRVFAANGIRSAVKNDGFGVSFGCRNCVTIHTVSCCTRKALNNDFFLPTSCFTHFLAFNAVSVLSDCRRWGAHGVLLSNFLNFQEKWRLAASSLNLHCL